MKNKIIVHTPQNNESRTYRYYNQFWFEFINFLKTKFDVIEDTYYEHANIRPNNIKLLSDNSVTSILECEMIIENVDSHEFVVMSVSDVFTSSILNHRNNPKCKKIIYSQFDENNLIKHINNDLSITKYSPWIYFPSNKFNIDQIYNERLTLKNLKNKFCFWGTSLEDRQILKHFNPQYFDGGRPIGNFENYARELIKYKCALSISGRAEFCYRDIENFGLGVPIIRFEYVNKMYRPLIPNYHYISIDRPKDLIYDRMGNKDHSRMIEDRFIEVIKDQEFLDFISKNAREYYENNLTMNNSIELTYNLLNLYEWE